ncbi:MAG TPA: hypothetical protein VLC95_18865, partial [Anaerolineae bacterium]|nr:hypothetical protein [Anaerolineae bacterium]
TYEPGTQEEVGYQANIDGDVAAYLVDPEGRSSLLFSDQVAAGQSRSRSWRLPDREGEWMLRAELNDDQARSSCRFSILLPPSPPVFGDERAEWADPYETCPGDPIYLYVSVFDDQPLARVELRSRPPGGQWTSSSMAQVDETTYVAQAVAYESPGLEYVFYAEDERGSWNETESYYLAAEPCFSIVYDFIASAADADWYAGVPYSGYEPYYDTYSLSFPGSDTDSSGFALWRDGPALEDGSQAPGRVLVTYPPSDEESEILGEYYLSNVPIYIRSGDAFVAQVGLLQGAGGGDVTFELYFAPIYVEGAAFRSTMHALARAQPEIIFLGRVYETYDGELTDWRISLDSIAGETGMFRLLVLAGDSASDDWATWVVARIERYGE